ncbi:hypothetical protein FB451DRAFT_381027 [Mycena latifolia]|nr:hypothetical protein FB451DRAFT_381027 [Mycena latifolia]
MLLQRHPRYLQSPLPPHSGSSSSSSLLPPPPRPRPPRPLPSPPCQHEDTRASANLQYGPALACALQRTSKREDHRAQRPLRAPLQRRPPMTQVRAAHLRAHAALGTGASAEHSFTNAEHFAHGDKIPGLKVSGIDIIAAQQAIKFARKWAVDDKSGPLIDFVTCRYGGHSCGPPELRARHKRWMVDSRGQEDPSFDSSNGLGCH